MFDNHKRYSCISYKLDVRVRETIARWCAIQWCSGSRPQWQPARG